MEAASLAARSEPFEDSESLMPVCPRCTTVNPVLSSQGDCCLNCGAEFVRCFASFRVLPVVAFETTVPADKVCWYLGGGLRGRGTPQGERTLREGKRQRNPSL